TSEGASRRGSFGAVRSCNGVTNPTIQLPSSADVRLRLINVDNTRVMMLGITGAEAFVIAIDGIACPPFPLETWVVGPAMRFDILIRSPQNGGTAQLVDYFAPKPIPIATFVGIGASRKNYPFRPRALREGNIPEPDLANARKMKFSFSVAASSQSIQTSPETEFDRLLLDELCLSFETNWAINKTVWPGRDHSELPPPIAVLERGQTYQFELRNQSSAHHPIHIHGHTFRVLKSNKRKRLPDHHADTILLAPKERVTVAFVADNPGDWMFHCHLIEHQETGMMSYLRVS
ncbi:MAG: multicopper oxidase domain-containing protein, partial [Paracoccaceae bacterium]